MASDTENSPGENPPGFNIRCGVLEGSPKRRVGSAISKKICKSLHDKSQQAKSRNWNYRTPFMSKRNFKEIFQRHQGSSIDLLNQKTPQWNALRLLTSGLGSSNLVHLKSKSGLYGNGQEKTTRIFERGCSMVCLPSG